MAYFQKTFICIGTLFLVSGDCFAPKGKIDFKKKEQKKSALHGIEKRAQYICFKCDKVFISEGFLNAHTMAAHNGPNSEYILGLLTKYPDFQRYLDGKEADFSAPQD